MEERRMHLWLVCVLAFSLILVAVEGLLVNITILESAVKTGAVCLDGSPPAYHLHRGFGSGINNWLIQLEGGGWCHNITNCLARKESRLGSSKNMASPLAFSGILHNKPIFNPGSKSDIATVHRLPAMLRKSARKAISGEPIFENYYDDIVTLHGSAQNLPKSCTSKLKPGLCFFPQNVVSDIKTPLFLINSAYDHWQIRNAFIPGVADPSGKWSKCKLNILNCLPNQLKTLQEYRLEFLKALFVLKPSPERGYFIDSCYLHCQTELQMFWHMPNSSRLSNKTVAQAAADWFFNRNLFRKIDCPYPCNKSCTKTPTLLLDSDLL
nr:pectin acetylesterase 8-like [Ipomoea trifida]